MMLLLKIKNGTPPMRKSALRQITEKAREFGPAALFNQILPLLMSPTLEDQERHLLVKVIDRIMYKLDDLVRNYVHKILAVIEPLLIDEDLYARIEGREIISNLAKAAGKATMITAMRPDIDHPDEIVRNTTARAFAVVASALGIPSLLPFLKAVCQSKKSWQARHTGIKIVQQIAILMGCAVLPHLKALVEIIEHGLRDEQQKVRAITALAVAALAEASSPYGIEAFDIVLEQLWDGMRTHSGRALASFLKAIGFIIPLMDADDANVYVKTVMQTLIRMFGSINEDEMKKVVLVVIKQCVTTEGVEAQYIRDVIMPPFFDHFWSRKMAMDKRNSKQLIETTTEIALKVGGAEIISRRVQDLKDDSEPFRKMAMETIERIVVALGVADINQELEDQMMDGIIYAFHQQTSDDNQIMLNGFGAVINCLGTRAKRHFNQICANVYLRLKNKSARVRQQAADLVSRIALVMKNCNEEKSLLNLGQILYENLGEEYPEVLGSILAALKAIVNVVGMTKMTPPIKDLLPSLTPILKNRHEKVQENCIDLVGRIADRGSSFVSPKEWMRICFDLLDLLKAHKKGIRRATVNTFGYIANAIGPQDVLVTLLNNLKVQERQNRVCTTVAIAIVAETCGPFTVLPALMNEYRVPEMNVQNGVLKSLSFMFEYIGEMGKDYIYAVTPLLEDALTDRDLVHRQTAASAVKHLALGVTGLGCEDALVHMLNYVWPNIFETSPHVINAVMEAVESMRVAVGAGNLFLYTVQGLFHPARRVRDVYWKIYNMLYVGNQDCLTPFYPVLENGDSSNDYTRHELISYFL
jgi:splicing factor 3B subunit 1